MSYRRIICDEGGVSASIDNSTESMQIIDYAHHEIHSGSHFFVDDVVNLALNSVIDLQWTMADATKWPHFTFEIMPEAETEWYIYEGAVITLAGTAVVPVNNNRNSTNVSNTTLTLIQNTSLSNANDDTDVTAAIQLAHGIIGDGKEGGTQNRDDELMLKQNTIYCLRAIANAAGYINFHMTWYEHTDKH